MRKLSNFKKKVCELSNKLFQKLNCLYIAIITIIIIGVGLLITSYWITNNDVKNIAVGLGTGIVTSALVTLYIEIINGQIQRKKLIKYKKMILNPLFNAVKSLYIQAIVGMNEYRVREEMENYLLLPMDDTKALSDFFTEMKKIDIESVKDEKHKKHLEDFSYVPLVYFKEVISQYNGIPFDSLILDNIITQEEYDKLKHFSLLNKMVEYLNTLNEKEISEQEKYYTRVQLLHGMLLFINRIMSIFDSISKKIEYENERIKQNLADVYFYEIYSLSEAYIEKECERAEAEDEYYAEHPELLENVEESEKEQLYRKINEAIWSIDAKTIADCFPQIDKNDKHIQSELTWSLAKDVMKDKELRKLYYEKYNLKYKVRREKRRKR